MKNNLIIRFESQYVNVNNTEMSVDLLNEAKPPIVKPNDDFWRNISFKMLTSLYSPSVRPIPIILSNVSLSSEILVSIIPHVKHVIINFMAYVVQTNAIRSPKS